jgi:DHA1 family arabinose polymer transporter-like MFS transporter
VFAVVLLIVYSWRHETHTGAINRLRQVHPEAIGSTPEITQV